jgi:CDP-diacylglycerol---serine O-phosphatidyltransferase
MAIKKHIPNGITLLNLFSGCIAIIFIFNDDLQVAAYLIFLAALFDFLDGMAARILKVKSDIGKELDSLADIVSFGLVPGFIMMKLIQSSFGVTSVNTGFTTVIPYIALLIPAFSALRLAKFNTDSRQIERFIGLPTPANAILIASLPLILIQNSTLAGIDIAIFQSMVNNGWFLISLTVLLSYLLIAEIMLMSLKFSEVNKQKNQVRYIFIGTSLILILFLFFAAIPFILLLYVFMSLVLKSKI